MWQRAAKTTDGAFSATFLQREWEQVILAQNLRDRAAYLACDRRGRGTGLKDAARERVWAGIDLVLAELRKAGQQPHLQVAQEAAEILAERGVARYQHVIVDEGQDLHPSQWRLLRAAVAPGADDLFIAADPSPVLAPGTFSTFPTSRSGEVGSCLPKSARHETGRK